MRGLSSGLPLSTVSRWQGLLAKKELIKIFLLWQRVSAMPQLCGIERIPERHRMRRLDSRRLGGGVGRGWQGLFIQQITILTPSRYTILLNMDAQ